MVSYLDHIHHNLYIFWTFCSRFGMLVKVGGLGSIWCHRLLHWRGLRGEYQAFGTWGGLGLAPGNQGDKSIIYCQVQLSGKGEGSSLVFGVVLFFLSSCGVGLLLLSPRSLVLNSIFLFFSVLVILFPPLHRTSRMIPNSSRRCFLYPTRDFANAGHVYGKKAGSAPVIEKMWENGLTRGARRSGVWSLAVPRAVAALGSAFHLFIFRTLLDNSPGSVSLAMQDHGQNFVGPGVIPRGWQSGTPALSSLSLSPAPRPAAHGRISQPRAQKAKEASVLPRRPLWKRGKQKGLRHGRMGFLGAGLREAGLGPRLFGAGSTATDNEHRPLPRLVATYVAPAYTIKMRIASSRLGMSVQRDC